MRLYVILKLKINETFISYLFIRYELLNILHVDNLYDKLIFILRILINEKKINVLKIKI